VAVEFLEQKEAIAILVPSFPLVAVLVAGVEVLPFPRMEALVVLVVVAAPCQEHQVRAKLVELGRQVRVMEVEPHVTITATTPTFRLVVVEALEK
jgi:hypothetical protein